MVDGGSTGVDVVAGAAAGVDPDFYALGPDGQAIHQRSRPAAVQETVRLLDVGPGMRVLEIGSGSGYSGALLAGLVTTSGHVFSVDIDPLLVDRAASLHTRHGYGERITMAFADGMAGHPAGAPYARIVAWAVPRLLPATWVQQTSEDGLIVASVKVAEVALINATIQVRVSAGRPMLAGVSIGYYLDMSPTGQPNEFLPHDYLDAARRIGDADKDWEWISSTVVRGDPATADHMLTRIAAPAFTERSAAGFSRWRELRAWLAVRHPHPGLVLARTAGGLAVGRLDGPHYALIRSDGTITADQSTSPMLGHLHQLLNQWEEENRPGIDGAALDLRAVEDGWLVRPTAQRPR